ncbi:hypothetical protein Nepgr_016445 [Nepenthes gracilis]|uniref:Uncharacterized protein n=1 Tax=Nepenthes gracilis TaxID=150966 RepID=A0AAD3SPR5_NEPGR|nr:hypothetical protein Nepgr_016445 [Nepenthes gracilis]
MSGIWNLVMMFIAVPCVMIQKIGVTGSDWRMILLFAEEWSAEEVANNPMLYALQCLLGENESQIFLNSIVKDKRAYLHDFLGLCWNDGWPVHAPALDTSFLKASSGSILHSPVAISAPLVCEDTLSHVHKIGDDNLPISIDLPDLCLQSASVGPPSNPSQSPDKGRLSSSWSTIVLQDGSYKQMCDALTSDDVSSDHPVLAVATPCVGEHDAGSFPRPLAVLEDAPIEVIVAETFSKSQPLSVTIRESPKLLVSLHLLESKTASFVKDPLHIEGHHIPSCAGEVLEVVPSDFPSEAVAEDAPTIDSTPSPHAVQHDSAPDDDSLGACHFVELMLLPAAIREPLPDGLMKNFSLGRQLMGGSGDAANLLQRL